MDMSLKGTLKCNLPITRLTSMHDLEKKIKSLDSDMEGASFYRGGRSRKQPIRTRDLGHVTGCQPIRDQYFLLLSREGTGVRYGRGLLLPRGTGVVNSTEIWRIDLREREC